MNNDTYDGDGMLVRVLSGCVKHPGQFHTNEIDQPFFSYKPCRAVLDVLDIIYSSDMFPLQDPARFLLFPRPMIPHYRSPAAWVHTAGF